MNRYPFHGRKFIQAPLSIQTTQPRLLLSAKCYNRLVVNRDIIYMDHACMDLLRHFNPTFKIGGVNSSAKPETCIVSDCDSFLFRFERDDTQPGRTTPLVLPPYPV